MTPLHALELRRDFVRSRQNALLGWPERSCYRAEDIAYFEMLEGERVAGRIEIEGKILTLEDFAGIE